MILTLKTIAYDADKDAFYSPDHRSFMWPQKGIVVRECQMCETKKLDTNCGCGIHTSPNPECLREYARYPNSIFVLLSTYTWFSVWTSPKDIPNCYVARAYAVQPVGIVSTPAIGKNSSLIGQRLLSAIRANKYFDVPLFSYKIAKHMIETTWVNNKDLAFSPYEPWSMCQHLLQQETYHAE